MTTNTNGLGFRFSSSVSDIMKKVVEDMLNSHDAAVAFDRELHREAIRTNFEEYMNYMVIGFLQPVREVYLTPIKAMKNMPAKLFSLMAWWGTQMTEMLRLVNTPNSLVSYPDITVITNFITEKSIALAEWNVIAMDPNLRGRERICALYHELGHFRRGAFEEKYGDVIGDEIQAWDYAMERVYVEYGSEEVLRCLPIARKYLNTYVQEVEDKSGAVVVTEKWGDRVLRLLVELCYKEGEILENIPACHGYSETQQEPELLPSQQEEILNALKTAHISLPTSVGKILTLPNVSVYLVGGAVRDTIMGIKPHDHDYVVVGATPSMMESLGFNQAVGASFPVYIDDEGNEIALARRETCVGDSHVSFEWETDGVRIEEDLSRRDLTINAMAIQLRPEGPLGFVIDPFNGQRDVKQRKLREVGTSFAEDPLRVFRAARFAAQLEFSPTDSLMKVMTKMSGSGALSNLPGERVWAETMKAMCCPAQRFYWVTLEACGALVMWFPEFAALVGVKQPVMHGGYDAWLHTLNVADECIRMGGSEKEIWAAMCHDVGKGVTHSDEWPHHYRHEYTGLPYIEELNDRLKAPKSYAKLSLLIAENHMRVHQLHHTKSKGKLKLLEKTDAFRNHQNLMSLLKVAEADVLSKPIMGYRDNTTLLLNCYLATKDIKLTEEEYSTLSGEEIGQRLKRARRAALSKLGQSQDPQT